MRLGLWELCEFVVEPHQLGVPCQRLGLGVVHHAGKVEPRVGGAEHGPSQACALLVLLVFVENESGIGGGPSPVGLVAGHHLGTEQHGVLRHVEAPNPFSLLLADGHVDGFPPIVAHDIDHAFDVGVVFEQGAGRVVDDLLTCRAFNDKFRYILHLGLAQRQLADHDGDEKQKTFHNHIFRFFCVVK